MFIKERWRIAFALGLLWAMCIAISFYLIPDMSGKNLLPGYAITSLFFICFGLIALFGEVRIFFPFIFMSKEDLLEYNVERISYALGVLTMAMAYAIIFLTLFSFEVGLVLIFAIAIIIEVVPIYASAAERFKADAPSETPTQN